MSIFIFVPPPDLNITLDNDIYPDGSTAHIPGTPGATGSGTLITYVVPAGKTLWLKNVTGTCNRGGKFTILNGASILGTFRTGGSTKNWRYVFDDAEELVAGSTLTVTFSQHEGTGSNVEAYARGRLL